MSAKDRVTVYVCTVVMGILSFPWPCLELQSSLVASVSVIFRYRTFLKNMHGETVSHLGAGFILCSFLKLERGTPFQWFD